MSLALASRPQWLLFAFFSLPLIAGAVDVDVGGLTGQLGVSPSGAATYTVPLTLPPGVAGAAPKLSLEYNSQAGLGIAGYGWRLGGGSGISRCPKTRMVDGVKNAVALNADDRFCLDGQRLILVSGVYGTNNAIYRTLIDNHSRITSYTHPAYSNDIYFKVETKDGKIIEYGSSSNSILRVPSSGSSIYWGVSRSYDKYQKGQLITYEYINEENKGQLLLSAVKYSYDVMDANPQVDVRFNYKLMDKATALSYFAGVSKKQDRILEGIAIHSVGGDSVMSEVSRYYLQYRTSVMEYHPELTSVKVCAINSGNETCLKPVNFQLPEMQGSSGNPFQMDMMKTPSSSSGWHAGYVWPGDYNGDGFTDLLSWDDPSNSLKIWYKNDDGTLTLHNAYAQPDAGDSWDAQRVWVGDYNGDGKAEILSYYNGRFTFFGVGSDSLFYKAVQLDVPTNGWDPARVWAGDYNGDGRTDLLSWDATTKVMKAWYATGNNTMLLKTVYNQSGAESDWDPGHAWVGDYNGDGKSDLVSNYEGDFTFWAANEDGGFRKIKQDAALSPYWGGHVWPGDYNGDGLTDLLVYKPGQIVMTVWYAYGNFLMAPYSVYTDSNLTNDWGAEHTWSADYNADGKTDLLGYWNGKFTLWTPKVDGSFSRVTQYGVATSGWNTIYTWLGNFNGDAFPDLISYTDGIFTKWLGNIANTRRVKSVETFAGTSYIDYESITSNSGIYMPLVYQYPEMSVRPPVYVVKSTRVPNPLGSTNQTDYRYNGLAHDVNKGSKGFLMMASIDHASKKRTDTLFANTFPYTGMILDKTVVYCSVPVCLNQPVFPFFVQVFSTSFGGSDIWGVNLLSRETNTLEMQTREGATTVVLDGVSQKQKVYFPYVKSTVINSYEPPAVN